MKKADLKKASSKMERNTEPLTQERLNVLSQSLARRDPVLRKVRKTLGPPPLWKRPASFATFVRIILEQQVSLASAKSTFDKTKQACGGLVTAERLNLLNPETLRQLGYSRQKSRYSLALAEDVLAKRFVIGRLRSLGDDEVREQITQRLGLGNWSADIYLLMSLCRPDIFPVGDLALVNGLSELDQTEYETTEAILERAERWRPHRAVASRMIWQAYLANRKKTIP